MSRSESAAANSLPKQVDAQPTQPTFVLIDGDCTFNVGLPKDYQTPVSLVVAFSAANIFLHMTMGNHDDRAAFLKRFPNDERTD